jgi:hypothetical protein
VTKVERLSERKFAFLTSTKTVAPYGDSVLHQKDLNAQDRLGKSSWDLA